MIYISDRPTVTAEQAQSILTKHTEALGIFIDLDLACEYQAAFRRATRVLYRNFHNMAGQDDLEPTQRVQVRSVLKNRFGVPAKLFEDSYNPNLEKLDKEVCARILGDESVSEDAKEFLNLYKKLANYNQRISYLGQYVKLPLCMLESFDGNRMVLAKPSWHVLTTKRISAKNPSVQNLYHDFANLITHPKGVNLVRGDSGQIEPRIIYSHFVRDERIKELIELYNDAYFGLVHYIMWSEMFEKHEISDTLKGLRSQIKTMGNAANYGSSMEGKGFDPVLARGFIARVQQHPLRKKWLEEAEAMIARGEETFYTVFGSPITPKAKKKYPKGTKSWLKHLTRCAINNPVQGTAGDLMNQSVYESDRIITEKAHGNINICYYKHDEGAWYIPDEYMHLADELCGCMAYQVRDWIPIYSDKLIGKKEGLDINTLLTCDADPDLDDEEEEYND